MKREQLLIIMIIAVNYLFCIIISGGLLSYNALLTCTILYAVHVLLVRLLSCRMLAIFVKSMSSDDVGRIYEVVNYSCNNYQQKYLHTSKPLKYYFFEYEKPIAFAFGANSIFVSSSILQLRQSQQSQICTQAAAETDSLRGLANLYVIFGNPLIVISFIFLLIGKFIIYIQLQLLKWFIVIILVLFDSLMGLSESIFFGKTTQSLSALWLLRFGSVFSADKISDIIYVITCNIISALLYILSYGQIAIVRQFDYSTDKILSSIWTFSEYNDFINTQFENIIPQQPSFSSDRLKLLCRITDAHIDSQTRCERIRNYYNNETRHKIKIHRSKETGTPNRIKIHKGGNNNHHEN